MIKPIILISIRKLMFPLMLVIVMSPSLLLALSVEAKDLTVYVDSQLTDIYKKSSIPDCSNYSSETGKCDGGSANAFCTIKDVNSYLATLSKDDTVTVLFKKNQEWAITSTESYLKINKDRVFIGAFGSGSLPVFDGKDTAYNDDLLKLHAPLIQINSNYCTVGSIRLVNAYGSAIRFSDVEGGLISQCQILKTGWSGIAIAGNSRKVAVEHCEITQTGWRSDLGPEPIEGMNHPQAINANTAGVDECLFRYNHIYNCYTEGIPASGHIVEYNLIGPTKASGIYAGEKPGVIRYNIIYGSSDSKYHVYNKNGMTWCSNGIGLNEEKYASDGIGSEVYGNIVIGRQSGIRVMNRSKVFGKKAYVYNNTFLDNANNFMISAPEYWQIDVKNNLSIVYDKTHSRHVACFGDSSGWDIGPNQWSSIPEDKNWYSTSRDEISDPKLRKTSGWTMLKSSTDFSFKDLTPLINSTAIENPKAIILSKYSGFQEIFLTSGTDLSKMPSAQVFRKDSQSSGGENWNFGAIIRIDIAFDESENKQYTLLPPLGLGGKIR
jgi:hypothetical protein